jgi:hypothetical protein
MSQPTPDPIGGPLPEAAGPTPDPADADTQQQRIRQTRSELGQTVAALTAKGQLRARARDKAARMANLTRNSAPVSQIGRAATAVRQHRRPALVTAVVVMVGTLATIAIMVRRRRPHRPSSVVRPFIVCRRRR